MMFFVALFLLVSCQNDKPKPETKVVVAPSEQSLLTEPVSAQVERSMTIHQHVKGRNVYIECVVSHFSFTNRFQEQTEGKGFIKVSLDNKPIAQVSQAAFTLKDLPLGRHTVKLEVMKSEGVSYGLTKEFVVHIRP